MVEAPIPHLFACDEIAGWSLIQIASPRASTLVEAVSAAFRVDAPAAIGEVARRGSATWIRVAPDRYWMIEDARAISLDLSRMPATGLYVTSLTDGHLRFRLRGRYCHAVLAKCVAIDRDAPGLPSERAVLTMLHRIPVLLHRLGAEVFDLYVPRSFAATLREWVLDAAYEFTRAPLLVGPQS